MGKVIRSLVLLRLRRKVFVCLLALVCLRYSLLLVYNLPVSVGCAFCMLRRYWCRDV